MIAAEGDSDEIVAQAIVRFKYPQSHIVNKVLPARGFYVVLRSCDLIARAAHFGLFDLLVVHFDLDASLGSAPFNAKSSVRIQKVADALEATIAILPNLPGRAADLKVALMAPLQSTDAWLAWGEIGGRTNWERKDRAQLKSMLYKSPPRGVIEKSKTYAAKLVVRLRVDEPRAPLSLRSFLKQL